MGGRVMCMGEKTSDYRTLVKRSFEIPSHRR